MKCEDIKPFIDSQFLLYLLKAALYQLVEGQKKRTSEFIVIRRQCRRSTDFSTVSLEHQKEILENLKDEADELENIGVVNNEGGRAIEEQVGVSSFSSCVCLYLTI